MEDRANPSLEYKMKCAILIDLDFFIRRYSKLTDTLYSSSEEKAQKFAKYLLQHSQKYLNYKLVIVILSLLLNWQEERG